MRNAVKAHWIENQLPIGSYIHAGGLEIRYEANETTFIDPAAVLELYKSGEITEEQFLEMVNIQTTSAKNILGGDQVAEFTRTAVSSTVDVRVKELPVENQDDEFVLANHKVRTKTKRKVFGGKSRTVQNTKQNKGRQKRRIITRVSK